MNIKRLNIQSWIPYEFNRQNGILGSEPYIEQDVVFNRNGIYLQGKKCWIEFNGKAFTYPIQTFVLDQKILEVNELNQRQIEALKQICLVGLATKKQKEILHIYNLFGKKLNVSNLRARKRLIAYREIIKQKTTKV